VLEGRLAADGHEGAELGVQALDSLQVELDELDRRDAALPDEASLLGRREERELGHRVSLCGHGRREDSGEGTRVRESPPMRR
jgi:hypothetical protein